MSIFTICLAIYLLIGAGASIYVETKIVPQGDFEGFCSRRERVVLVAILWPFIWS